MNRNFAILIVFVVTLMQSGCDTGQLDMKSKQPAEIDYPYEATHARKKQIMEGCSLIAEGMTKEDVVAKMGEPDEVNPQFDKDDWDKQVGMSYVYLLSRKSPNGSAAEKDEHLVRIIFDNAGKVARIDKW